MGRELRPEKAGAAHSLGMCSLNALSQCGAPAFPLLALPSPRGAGRPAVPESVLSVSPLPCCSSP